MKAKINSLKNEIKIELDLLIKGCELLDIEKAFKVFSNSSDFFMIGSDGNYYDYQTFINNNKNYFDICSKFELTTIKEEIKILSNDLAIVSWALKLLEGL